MDDAIIKKVEDALLKAEINFDARIVENGIIDPSSRVKFPEKYVDDLASAYVNTKGTPCATHWSMMLALTSAKRYTLASRAR